MEKRPSAAVAALFALFISSFTGLTAFAEEPTYSETKSVPMEQPKKKDQPVQKADGEIFQENLETHNALLNTPTQTEVTDEGMEGYMVRNVQVSGNNIVPAGPILKKALTTSGLALNPNTLQIDEGIIENITVTGTKKTKDYVVLREVRFKPGEPFNINQARRSIQRLNNLEFIAGSDMRLTRGKEDPRKLAVEVQVVEDSPLILGAGVGYSESERVFGTVTVEDPNFLGTGDKARVSWEIGSKSKSNYTLSYTHPWLDKKETTLDVKVYGHTHEYTEYDRGAHEVGRYDKKSNGQEITLSRAEGEYTRNYIRLKRRNDKYVKPIDGYSTQYYESSYDPIYEKEFGTPTTADQRRKQNFGETRSITLMRITDKRDNVFFPRTGNMTTLSLEQAGFGGDFNFTKLFGEYRYYIPVKKHVVAMDVMAGYGWGRDRGRFHFSFGYQF